MPKGISKPWGPDKKRVSSEEFRISAQGQAEEMGTQGCHLSSSLPGLASGVQLGEMLCEALEVLGENLHERGLRRVPRAGENLPTERT